MKKLISRTVSAALAVSMLCSGAASLPASAEGLFTKESSFSFYLGAITDEKPVISTSYKSSAKYITISWDKVKGASGYRVYRKQDGSSKYKMVSEISGKKNVTYKDTDVKPNTRYSYKVKAFKGVAERQYSKASKVLRTVSAPDKVKEITKVWGSGVTAKLKWKKQPDCDGYIVYYYAGYDGYSGYDSTMWKKAAVINSPDKVSASINTSEFGHGGYYSFVTQFRVKSFSTDASGKIKTSAASKTDTYIDMSEVRRYCGEELAMLSKVEKGESRMTYTYENAQPKKSITETESMSSIDRSAIEKFAKNHFAAGWSDEEKVYYTLTWINRNVTYDTEYSHIRAGYADSIFNGRYGQCTQYNGALIEMMAYLGYDVSLIRGLRGSEDYNWQHFWGEVSVGKRKYVMEAGNYGQDGIWSFFCTSYKEASGYIKNQKAVTK